VGATDLQVAFGEVVRELRLEAGLSQEALSFACGRHRTYVSLIERGRNAPSITTLWLMAKALDITPSVLIEHVQERLT
jgi:transcriptional regulator with XRE-family HTH domain